MVEKLFFHLFALPTVFKLHGIIQKDAQLLPKYFNAIHTQIVQIYT